MKKDIEAAYNAEIQYYKDKETLHSNVLDILDYIQPCGYDTYEEYFADVQEYKLKIQNYEIEEVEDVIQSCYIKYVENKQPAFLYLIHSSNNYAFVPNSFDKYDLLEQYNFIPVKMNYTANNGIIITSDKDLRIVIVIPYEVQLPEDYFIKKLRDYLALYFNNVIADHNDILIDNKKVCGYVRSIINDMYVYMFQITFVDRSELIKQICTTSIKEPGFIDEKILSQEKIKNEFLTWLKQ